MTGQKVNFITPSRETVTIQTVEGVEIEARKSLIAQGYIQTLLQKKGCKSEMKIVPLEASIMNLMIMQRLTILFTQSQILIFPF